MGILIVIFLIAYCITKNENTKKTCKKVLKVLCIIWGILLFITFIFVVYFMITFFKDPNPSVKEITEESYSQIYNIEYIETVANTEEDVFKMRADNIDFYVRKLIFSNGLPHGDASFYSTIVSSLYEKNKNQIMKIAQKYNLKIEFEEDVIDYYVVVLKIKIEASQTELNNIHNFATEVVAIEDIKKIYDIWKSEQKNRGDFHTEDFSEIIVYDDNNQQLKRFSIFEEMNENVTNTIDLYNY